MAQLDGFWSTPVQPWSDDFDYLGHLTAAVYPRAYEQGRLRYLRSRWQTTHPAYVVASHSMRYVKEILEETTPLQVLLRPVKIGRASFVLDELLVDARGAVCNLSEVTLVAWDLQARRSRPLEQREREGLELDLGSVTTQQGER